MLKIILGQPVNIINLFNYTTIIVQFSNTINTDINYLKIILNIKKLQNNNKYVIEILKDK